MTVRRGARLRRSPIRGGVPALSVALLVASSGGCSCRSERNTEPVTAATGRWNRAFATVEYHPSFYKNGRDHPPSVAHSISIEEAYPNRSYVILVQETEDSVSSSVFRGLRKTEYTLQFAPDGSALAASTDGGHAWTLFDLASLDSPTEEPFWCRHRSVASLAPWPSMRGIALEILAAVDMTSPTAHVHRGEELEEWPGPVRRPGKLSWEEEILGASRYACARKDDAELRSALIHAYGHRDYVYPKFDVADCVKAIAKSDPEARRKLQESLAAGDASVRTRLEGLLAHLDDPAPAQKKDPPAAPKGSGP